MKKLLLSVVAMLMVTMAGAQELMKVQLANGTVLELNVDSIKSIYFEEKSAPEVEPADFTDPITTWGLSPAEVKALMVGFTLENEEDGTLQYGGQKKELAISYQFDAYNELVYSCVILDAEDVTAEAVDAKIQQSYVLINETDDGTKVYMSTDYETVVFFSAETDEDGTTYYVEYISYAYLMSNSTYFTEPYLGWGTDREAVKDTLAQRGYELYKEYDTANNYYALAYYGNDQEGLIYYMFDDNKKLDYVQLLFEDISIEDMGSFMTEELGYTFDGQRTIEDEDLVVYDYITADGTSWVIMYEEAYSDEEYGDYTILTLAFYENIPEEEEETRAKSRTGNDLSKLMNRMSKFNVSASQMRTLKLRNISKLQRIRK